MKTRNKTLKRCLLACLMVCISSCGGRITLGSSVKKALSKEAPSIISSNVTTSEDAGSSAFEVTLSHAYAEVLTVKYNINAAVAEKGEDYNVSEDFGTLTFNPGETSKTIPITFHNDKFPENREYIDLELSDASSGTIVNNSVSMSIMDFDSNFFGADVDSLNQITGPAQAPDYKFLTQNTLTVDPAGTGGAYTTIQQAVNAATPGTQILVNSGVYAESIALNTVGDSALSPIVIKANNGHTPVITGADEILHSGITNLNTDGNESGLYTEGFESGTTGNFDVTVSAGNTFTVVNDATNSYLGSHSAQLEFGGTTSQSMLYDTFADWSRFGTPGNEYQARVMFKLNSTFTLESSLTKGVAVFRTETFGVGATSQFTAKIFPTADPDVFTINLLHGTTILTGSTTINRGDWVRLDVYFKKSSGGSDGIARMNINGTNIVNYTNHTYAQAHDRFRLGSVTNASSNYAIPTAGSRIYFDNHRFEEWEHIPPPTDTVTQVIHEDGFETDLSAYTASSAGGNSSAITSSGWDGTHSVKFNYAGTSAQNSLKRTFTPTSSDIHARVLFKLNSAFDLTNDGSRVSTPSATNEIAKELDLISLYGANGSVKRLKVSLLKRGSRFLILGKILSIKDESNNLLSWASTNDIQNYLLIYKGHSGEIQKNVWNSIELRYAGERAEEGGVEIWLNGVSIASNINRTSQKYDGLSTKDLKVDTVELGAASDLNTGVSATSSMQTTAPVNGSEIDFDGLKISTGAPAGFSATGSSPVFYQYSYTAPGAGEKIPATLIVGDNVLMQVNELNAVAPGTFYVNTTERKVTFRLKNDQLLTTQRVFSGRRSNVINIQNSSNVVFQGLTLLGGTNDEVGCFHVVNSTGIKMIGNTIKGCSGPAIRVMDTWNAPSRSSDILISGNSFIENGKVFGGGVRLDHMGDTKILNNYFNSALGNGITSSCVYTNGGQANLTTDFCKNITIARNVFDRSIESAIYLTSKTFDSKIYSNIIQNARESGYAIQTTNGAWRSSGGSGLHIARGGHNNLVYNNLVYNVDRGAISLRAAVIDTKLFNNTAAESGNYIFASGASVDFQRDSNEVNEIHNDPTRGNKSYNNIYSFTYGSNSCVDLEGYDAGAAPAGSMISNGPDEDNMSDHNIFYNCARLGKYNSTAYTNFLAFVNATTFGSIYDARESHSEVYSGTLYRDSQNHDYRLDTGAVFTAIPYDIKAYVP